jgi:hypothetical protein
MNRSAFTMLTPVGGKCSASRPGRFTPGGKARGTHWRVGWVDPSASQDDMLLVLLGSSALLLGLGLFSVLLIKYTVGRTPWAGDQPVARPLHTDRTTQTRNKHTQTSMLAVGFEPIISVLEWAKTVHASDRAPFLVSNSDHLDHRGGLVIHTEFSVSKLVN